MGKPENRGVMIYLAGFATLIVFGIVVARMMIEFAMPRSQFALIGTVSDYPTRDEPYKVFAETVVYMVHIDEELIAISSRPPHEAFRSCPLHWDALEKKFFEPCGGSTFAIDGTYKSGPSPRGLDRHPLIIEGDEIRIDLLHIIEGEYVR